VLLARHHVGTGPLRSVGTATFIRRVLNPRLMSWMVSWQITLTVVIKRVLNPRLMS